MVEATPEKHVEFALFVGEYTLISHVGDFGWWLTNSSGEGMEISNIELEILLADYFKENF